MTRWTQVVGLLNKDGETEALYALNLLDITRLNKVMVILMRFIKYMEGNDVSYFGIFPMLQKLMVNLGSLFANKHAETPM
jgi:hypothetical protein